MRTHGCSGICPLVAPLPKVLLPTGTLNLCARRFEDFPACIRSLHARRRGKFPENSACRQAPCGGACPKEEPVGCICLPQSSTHRSTGYSVLTGNPKLLNPILVCRAGQASSLPVQKCLDLIVHATSHPESFLAFERPTLGSMWKEPAKHTAHSLVVCGRRPVSP